jgi:hypothetical protein
MGLGMESTPHRRSPRTCTASELGKVGVSLNRRDQTLVCRKCRAVWTISQWLHKRPRFYWACPNGCNIRTEIPEAPVDGTNPAATV